MYSYVHLEGVGSDGVDGPPQALDGSVVIWSLSPHARVREDLGTRLLQRVYQKSEKSESET